MHKSVENKLKAVMVLGMWVKLAVTAEHELKAVMGESMWLN